MFLLVIEWHPCVEMAVVGDWCRVLCYCAGRGCAVSTMTETLVLAAEVANSTRLVQIRVCVINRLFWNELCLRWQYKWEVGWGCNRQVMSCWKYLVLMQWDEMLTGACFVVSCFADVEVHPLQVCCEEGSGLWGTCWLKWTCGTCWQLFLWSVYCLKSFRCLC